MAALTLIPFLCRICKKEAKTTGMDIVWFRSGWLKLPQTCSYCTVKFADGMEIAGKNQEEILRVTF